jgi:uncharacterized protein (TIGR02453 family)
MRKRGFTAFPKEALDFLRSLKRHNNRDWFHQHKAAYEQYVKQPMLELIAALAEDFQQFAPEMVASPKVSPYRIYRDTRFSKDKSPYKTHLAASFPRSGMARHEGAGFYLHIAPSELLIGGGLYSPLPEDLNAVRQRIADDPMSFQKIVNRKQFRRLFGNLEGERLSRVPRGYAPDHPGAGYLKYKQFLVMRTFPAEQATEPSFYPMVIETFRGMLPLVRFLNEPILAAQRIRERQGSLLGG